LDDFVRVDVDGFREQLPEWPLYLSDAGSDAAGALTQRESGYLAELAQELALNLGRSVLVDGSLRDVEWFRGVFGDIRARYPHYRIAILHVTASWETVKARAAARAAAVGRAVPQDQLWEAFETVPTSVAHLAPYADLAVELCNETEATVVRLVMDGLPVLGQPLELLEALRTWLDQELPEAAWFDEPEAWWAAVALAAPHRDVEQGLRFKQCFKASDAPTARPGDHRRLLLWSGGWMRASACA
jgi:predicted kinase